MLNLLMSAITLMLGQRAAARGKSHLTAEGAEENREKQEKSKTE